MNDQNTIEQFKNSELTVSLRPEDTTISIPVNLILKIIKEEDYYLAFVSNFENNKHIFGNISQALYAKSIEQFINAVNKNKYDFQLTEEHHNRINYIIDNFSNQNLNYLKDLIELYEEFDIDVSDNKYMDLEQLYKILTDNKLLNKLFNGIDRNKDIIDYYSNKEVLTGLTRLIKELEENYEEYNLSDEDPIMYRLISIVHAFKDVTTDSEYKITLNEAGIAEVIKKLDKEFLVMLISNKTVPLEVKKLYLNNMSEQTRNFIYNEMELSERNRIATELGIWPVDEKMQRRIEALNDYVNNELIPRLKKVFNGYVSEEIYNEILGMNLYYNNIGYITKYSSVGYSLAINNGIYTAIDIETPYNGQYKEPDLILIDAITHESIHNISKSYKGAGFSVKNIYSGMNEAITQYLAEEALGEQSYVSTTGQPYCKYYKSVEFIRKLVDIGIFTVPELAYNYVNNNAEYLQESITKYTDIDTYNQMIQYFYTINKSTNYQDRKTAIDKLDSILVELREKKKKNKIETHKRS